MRVPNINTYYTATYRLGNLTEDLKNANEVVSTQKQINEVSDDPLGLSQTLSLRNSIGTLEQIERNVIMGKSWLDTGEDALDSVNKLILEAKTEATRLTNDSITADERNDAIERIDNIIEQIVSLGNTQVNGNYIFGGTDTNTPPFIYDRSTEPDRVLYTGNNNPFEIRTDTNSEVEVGRDGQETFWGNDITINTTNNTILFQEDNGHGPSAVKILEAVIPNGLYTKEELETAVKNVLNEVSQTQGYGVTYEVEYDADTQRYNIREDGSFDGYIQTKFLWDTGEQAYLNQIETSSGIPSDQTEVTLIDHTVLTLGTTTDPENPKPLTFKWNKAEGQWDVENDPGYELPATVSGSATSLDIDLDQNGIADILVRFDEPVADGEYVRFEIIPAKGDHSAGHEIGFNGNDTMIEPPVSDTPAQHITDLIINPGVNDAIVFQEVNSAGVATTLTADINVTTSGATYTDMDLLARAIETEMEAESAALGNSIDYAVSYDPENSRFNIREDGSQLNEINLLWTASTASAGVTLGYYPLDDAVTYPASSITIDSQNSVLDFQEENPPGTFTTLQARIPVGEYETMADLAAAVETAMETVSASSGNTVTYSVAYNSGTSQFEIQRSGGAGLTSLNLLWNSGSGAAFSIGETLGYDTGADDVGGGLLGPYASDAEPAYISSFSMSIDDSTKFLDFEEVTTAGVSTTLSAEIAAKTYTSIAAFEQAVEQAMNQASQGGTYDVSYDEATNRFEIQRSSGTTLSAFNLLWASGPNLGQTAVFKLGYDTALDDTGGGIGAPYTGNTDPVWMSFDGTNNKIDFREINIDGTFSEEISVAIPARDYTHPSQVASEIEKVLNDNSPNNVDYSVIYDPNQGFRIKGSDAQLKGFDLLWQTGNNSSQSAAEMLGFTTAEDIRTTYGESDQDVVNITIDATNNKIDFKEVTPDDDGKSVSSLTASIEQKVYTSHAELASEIEKALEAESRQNGNTIDYSVSFDEVTKKFTIKENGTRLEEFRLQWNSGDNAPLAQGGTGQTIGAVIGFDGASDDVETPMTSVRDVEWGIFNTLIDLKQYLADNDRDGIERSIDRLELNYDNMTSKIVDIGMKYGRLQVRESITSEVNLSLTERRSNIEDADIIESIMKLQSIETAYQAALSSTSKVLNISLVDYLT